MLADCQNALALQNSELLPRLAAAQGGDDLRFVPLQQRPHVQDEARKTTAGEAAGSVNC
jgi:hypothetical protein